MYLTKYATYGSTMEENNSYIYHPRFILGVIIFFAGMYINWDSDNILRNLRKPGETGYKIPTVCIRYNSIVVMMYNDSLIVIFVEIDTVYVYIYVYVIYVSIYMSFYHLPT